MDRLKQLSAEACSLLHEHKLLAPLVRAELLLETVKETSVDNEAVEQILEQFKSQQQLSSDETFQDWLTKNRTTATELRQKLTIPLQVARYSKEKFQHQAEAHFLKRKLQLDQVVYSILRVKDFFEARELYLQVSEGERDFGELAEQFSQGPERNTRGLIGPTALMKGHPQLVQLLRSSNPGQAREPVQIEGWWLVVRLERLKPAELDAAMENQITQELFNEVLAEDVERMLSHLLVPNGQDSFPPLS